MNNKYLFIIWHNALWCENKIVEDLKQHFKILNDFYIDWNDSKLEKNFLAFYGRKLGPASDKIFTAGKGTFRFLLIEDPSPKFETRKMFDGEEKVNINIYDIKMKYRKWTAGGHRIHCSDTEKETMHDLVVLFGPDYEKVLNTTTTTLSRDSIAVNGFDNINDLNKALSLFGDNITRLHNNNLKIISMCRFDIVAFLNPTKKVSDHKYELMLNDASVINIEILGELDGDMPSKTFNLIKDNVIDADIIFDNMDEYISFIDDNKKMPSIIEKTFKTNNLSLSLTKINPVRVTKSYSFIQKLKLSTKLLIKKLSH